MFRSSSCPSSEATTTAVAASGLPLELSGSSAVGSGQARPDHDQQNCYHQAPMLNQRLLLQLELLMMDMRMPETCWAVFKWQVMNLRNCCIWLIDSVEITGLFMKSQVHYNCYKDHQWTLHYANYLRVTSSLFTSYKIHFNIILPPTPKSRNWRIQLRIFQTEFWVIF
jgi:hypothetical protein